MSENKNMSINRCQSREKTTTMIHRRRQRKGYIGDASELPLRWLPKLETKMVLRLSCHGET